MTLHAALDVSQFHIALNTTGSEPALVRRYMNGRLAAFKPKSPGPGWTQAPINHAVAVDVDANAWVPVQDQAQVYIL
jgi:hypothetical protein